MFLRLAYELMLLMIRLSCAHGHLCACRLARASPQAATMEGLYLCDPFQIAFQTAVGSRDPSAMITSEATWRHFLSLLEAEGLLSDGDVMEDIWSELSKDGRLFRPKGEERIQLTFGKWREMLAERFPPDTAQAAAALQRIKQEVRGGGGWGLGCDGGDGNNGGGGDDDGGDDLMGGGDDTTAAADDDDEDDDDKTTNI
jgi:hypothetical protein